MGQPFVKSILAISGSVLLALIYILAPVQQGILAWAHDLEHEFYHITSSAHEHGFLSADELLAEAGHDHRTLEYIKQVLEPFEDDFKKEEEKNQLSFKIQEHLQTQQTNLVFRQYSIHTHRGYAFYLHIQKSIALRIPVPPPQL